MSFWGQNWTRVHFCTCSMCNCGIAWQRRPLVDLWALHLLTAFFHCLPLTAGQTKRVNDHKKNVVSVVYILAAGKGSWSGYGPRPRGQGIVDQCCRPGGCGLHVLERYCAKPKDLKEQQTMTTPTVTSVTRTITVRPECRAWTLTLIILFHFFK